MSPDDKHIDCSAWDPCEAGDPAHCPREPVRRSRAEAQQGAWSPLVLRRDAGGLRHFLDGEPVYCGSTLELQAVEIRSDDYGDYHVPVQRGQCVRYEAALHAEPVKVTLYGDIAGHTFEAPLWDSMRFRRPPKRD